MLLNQMITYIQNNQNTYVSAVGRHMVISIAALVIAIIIAVPSGILCAKLRRSRQVVITFFGILRIIPSLAVLVLLLPIMGTGMLPAMIALVLLAIPPILMNTVAGLEAVPEFMIETGISCGMTQGQVWQKVLLPLALPMMISGIRTAAVEIVASATLAAKIGAGGLGEIIFTGLGLNRPDLLLVGGISVAVLSCLAGLFFDLLNRNILKYKNQEG